MNDLEIIQQSVGRAARRRRWLRAWRGLWQGLFFGAILWLVVLGCYKIFPIPFIALPIAAAGGFLFLIAGFFSRWSRLLPLSETARVVDEKLKLQERLGTALEFSQSSGSGNWKELLLADAAPHARALDPRRLFPAHLPLVSRWTVLILALAVGLGFVPEFRSKAYAQKQNEKTVIKEVGKHIGDLTRRELAQRPPALEKTKENLETIEQLGNQLSKVSLTRAEALKDLTSAAEKLKNEMKELGRNPALKPLERAARETSRGGNSLAEMQKQIESLQKSLGEKGSNTDALDKLKKDLQKAQQTANEMASANAPENSAAEKQLAQSLADLAQQAKEIGLPLDKLDDAIAALQAQQIDSVVKELGNTLQDLEKLQAMAEALAQLQQQAAAKIGKDLAEQLKNGQATAAQKTLEQMVAQLQQSNLSAEQIKKLLEEVSQAIDPAGEYGKVKELLSSAVGQMKQGEKSDAAKSLSDAANELKKILQQMGDAQSLAASLAMLQQAQQCIGNCQGWGQSKRSGTRPGRSTGILAEENNWLYLPNYDERQDASKNSPGNAPFAWNERGDGKLADNLAPDKLRGTFNPGAPMPSVTLRGVSIKGQSKVQYQEAVSAAQSEAQSALNQDQVPRAYQGAVKNYFDDLKE